MLLLVLRNESKHKVPKILGHKTYAHSLPSVDILVINEQRNKDCIRGEKRILVEMRPEVPFASVRVFSESSKSDSWHRGVCSLHVHDLWINFTITIF